MHFGLLGGTNRSLETLAARARQAEADGFASIWFTQLYGVDALTAATVCGLTTSRIEIATGVVPIQTRHPYALAQQALSTQAATNGRFTLGIGLSHRAIIEDMFGISYTRPVASLREYLAVLMPLLREGRVDFAGQHVQVHASLTVDTPCPCPVVLAALGPAMLELAGRVADGTVTWMTGPRTLREHTIPTITETAQKAERPSPRIVAILPIAVTTDTVAARSAAAKIFQYYGELPSYRAMLDREGATGPGDVAIVGDEDAVGEQLERLAEAGVTDFVAAIYPTQADETTSMERTRSFLTKLEREEVLRVRRTI